MSKKILFRVGLASVGVLVAVLWLVSVLVPETFGWFNLSIAIAIFSGIAGIMYICRGIFNKGNSVLKKISIMFGAGLLVVCIIAIAGAIAIPKNIILPIIAIIITVALLIGVFAVGGKHWDEADNQKVGYKTYRERKADEEKQKENNDNKE